MLKKNVLIGLMLLPAFFLLHNYNEIFGFIRIEQVVKYGLIIYGALAAVLIALVVRRKWDAKSALILFCFSFFVLLFGPITNYVRFFVHSKFFGSYYVVFIACIAGLFVITRKISKGAEIQGKTNFFVNLATIFLTITELVMLWVNGSEVSRTQNLIYPGKPLSSQYTLSNLPDSSKPDIYFFVFDAYTNDKMLKQIWNFDNTNLTNWLDSNGFHIPSETRSNYNFTAFSVSSTFNMNYISPDKGSNASVPKNILQANKSLSDNETLDILKKEHYTISFLAPFKNSIQENSLGQFFEYLSDRQIFRQTLIGSLHDSKMWVYLANKITEKSDSIEYKKPLEEKFRLIRSTVDKIKSTVDSSSNRRPHFVYGHIMVPHEPPLFDSLGRYLSYDQTLHASMFDTYTWQIRYANSVIREIVAYIKSHNKANTIIIIEGDHGFGFFPQDSIPKYAFSNFDALYFPDKNYSRIYETVSPVNIFRIVFDQFFGQQYALLKDTSTVVRE